MRKGDLVVFRNATGNQLKRKIYTVVDPMIREGGYDKIRVMDAYGKQKNDVEWYYVPIAEYESTLNQRILIAEHDVQRAQVRVNKHKDILAKFKEDKAKASTWFPKV